MCDKEQFEKLRKGLEHEMQNRGQCGHYCGEGVETVSCRYDKSGLCIQHWGKDALSLIRQQAEKIHELQTKVHELQTVRTASVMTLEEVKAIPLKRDHVWVERLVKECYREVFGKTTLFCLQKLEHFGYEDDPDDGGPSEGVFWITPTKQFYKTRWDEYGKSFVCWTFKPTDEQREAVKWE